jgi:hypothetical protein
MDMTKNISNKLQTDKSDKTITVSNLDFLMGIFGTNEKSANPILVSFKGNPAKVAKQKWCGYSWKNASTLNLSSDANNYFSLAIFKPNEAGEYRRKKSQFHSLHVRRCRS